MPGEKSVGGVTGEKNVDGVLGKECGWSGRKGVWVD